MPHMLCAHHYRQLHAKLPVSITTRIEITKQLRAAYKTATKTEKTLMLNQFCAATGLSRQTARRYLTNPAIGNPKIMRLDRHTHRPLKYSKTARQTPIHIWVIMGMPCGKYMASQMREWITSLEHHRELKIGKAGYTPEIASELTAMSAATIDRYLAKERKRLELKGISATRHGEFMRDSITVRKSGDEAENTPGFFEIDTVAHCGPALKGEFARTLTMTDVKTGWVHLEVMRNNARVHMIAALERAFAAIPFYVSGLDCDNGSEFLNKEVIAWAGQRDIFITRARPYKKNNQAHVESKNNHVVRKYGFHYRYDSEQQRLVLAKLWRLVCLKMNFLCRLVNPWGGARML